MVRINGSDLGAAIAALKFFGFEGDRICCDNKDLIEGLDKAGYYVDASNDPNCDDSEESIICLSTGMESLNSYRNLEGNVYTYYHNTPDNIQAYLDMDGVFADFEGYFISKLGKERFETMTSTELWRDYIGGKLKGEEEQVFSKFPLMENAMELYEFFKVYNPIFLSSTGFSNTARIGGQKRAWLEKYFGPDIKFIFVDQSKKKAYYAAPNAILIDDRPKSLLPFVEAGGHGILHTNVEKTITEFMVLYEKVRTQIKKE